MLVGDVRCATRMSGAICTLSGGSAWFSAVMKMATLDAARAMKLDGKLGSIAVGKVADLMIVPGDPLADIAALEAVTKVVSRGNVFDSAKLYQAVGVAPK